MWKHLFDGFNLIHGVLLILGAGASFRFWVRNRFRFPKYIHILAAIGFAISIWVSLAMPPDAPASQAGVAGRVLIALALPAMIYFFFIVYGGPRAAFHGSTGNRLPCPFCQSPVPTLPEGRDRVNVSPRFAEPRCRACGGEFT